MPMGDRQQVVKVKGSREVVDGDERLREYLGGG